MGLWSSEKGGCARGLCLELCDAYGVNTFVQDPKETCAGSLEGELF